MLNRITLCGRTTTDIELKSTNSGKNVASFTLAVDRDYSANGERETDFIPVVVWGKTAEFASRYFTKGQMMIVDGRLQVRKYTDKDGNNRSVAEVIADKIHFCGSKGENQQNTANYTPVAESPSYQPTGADFDEIGTDDDLPF